MGLRQGPMFDRILMRLKDIGEILTLIGLGWAVFKGIDKTIQRFERVEATVLSQNLMIIQISKKEEDISEMLNEIQYPDRYPQRQHRRSNSNDE